MSNRRSKFSAIFDQVEAVEAAEAVEPPAAHPAREAAPAAAQRTGTPKATERAPAKPLAKSKDPAYTPVTLYMRRDVYQRVQMQLLTQGRQREVSDVANELFAQWLTSHV